jgi:cell division septation protein DedD
VLADDEAAVEAPPWPPAPLDAATVPDVVPLAEDAPPAPVVPDPCVTTTVVEHAATARSASATRSGRSDMAHAS